MTTRRLFFRLLPFLGSMPLIGKLKPLDDPGVRVPGSDRGNENHALPSPKRYTPPPTLWYENENGDRWIPDEDHYRYLTDPPEGFIYQHSQFPRELHKNVCAMPGHQSHTIASGSSSWPEALVLAMAHDGYTLSQAILIAANMCERCMNAAAHDYRSPWGYPRGSEQYWRANTQCEFCLADSCAVGRGFFQASECGVFIES